MKISKILILGVVAISGFNQLFGQPATTSTSAIKFFGIGLHVEQFKYEDISDLNSAPVNKIVLTFNASNSFRIEPEFGFMLGNNTISNIKNNSSVNVGLGLFKMMKHNKLNIYGGLRLEYADIQFSSNNFTNNNGNPETLTTKTNRFIIGPAIGCEYSLDDNFTFGGEVVIKYASLKTSYSPSSYYYKDEKSYYFTTDAGLFVRFYF